MDLIVVGLDNTPAGSAALRWAVDHASQRGARVLALNVYEPDLRDPQGERSTAHLRAHRQVFDVVGRIAAHLPIAVSVVDGPVAQRLIDESGNAVTLVIGKPQGSTHAGLPAELSAACQCPVVLIDELGNEVRDEPVAAPA
jgi:nucleotide-binding universal stress UspA family protein